jgi:hypothetical protein
VLQALITLVPGFCSCSCAVHRQSILSPYTNLSLLVARLPPQTAFPAFHSCSVERLSDPKHHTVASPRNAPLPIHRPGPPHPMRPPIGIKMPRIIRPTRQPSSINMLRHKLHLPVYITPQSRHSVLTQAHFNNSSHAASKLKEAIMKFIVAVAALGAVTIVRPALSLPTRTR